MDIGIDCSCLAKAERTGVARYCSMLVNELPSALAPDDRVTLLYRISRLRRRRWFEHVDDRRFSNAVFQDRVAALAPKRLDVDHGPDLRIPRLRGVPAVSTVHDLSALDVPGIAAESFQERKLAALADVAARASVILCISEFTEGAFLSRFPAAAGRTRVVPLGLSPRFGFQDPGRIEAVRAARGLPPRYVLFVGQIAARKNLPPLLEGFQALRARPEFADLVLVLAGPVQTGGAEVLASPAADASVRAIGFIGDDELPALYGGALAFVFPGKGEGFGLPLLEAMACRTPVVAARAGANDSTAGDAALFVDPDSPEEFRDALARVIDDRELRADLLVRGVRRAAAFSWAETARRTVQAYRDAAQMGVPRRSRAS